MKCVYLCWAGFANWVVIESGIYIGASVFAMGWGFVTVLYAYTMSDLNQKSLCVKWVRQVGTVLVWTMYNLSCPLYLIIQL
jgi:hypothetical protein